MGDFFIGIKNPLRRRGNGGGFPILSYPKWEQPVVLKFPKVHTQPHTAPSGAVLFSLYLILPLCRTSGAGGRGNHPVPGTSPKYRGTAFFDIRRLPDLRHPDPDSRDGTLRMTPTVTGSTSRSRFSGRDRLSLKRRGIYFEITKQPTSPVQILIPQAGQDWTPPLKGDFHPNS